MPLIPAAIPMWFPHSRMNSFGNFIALIIHRPTRDFFNLRWYHDLRASRISRRNAYRFLSREIGLFYQKPETSDASPHYPEYLSIGKDEPIDQKTMVNIAWMMSDNADYETSLILEIIAALLDGERGPVLCAKRWLIPVWAKISPRLSGIEADLKQFNVLRRPKKYAKFGRAKYWNSWFLIQ